MRCCKVASAPFVTMDEVLQSFFVVEFFLMQFAVFLLRLKV